MRASSRPPASRDLLIVDLRGMKATLLERAKGRGVSLSAWIRDVVSAAIAKPEECEPVAPDFGSPGRLRVSLRLAAGDARRLADDARAAGLPIGRYVTALMAERELVPAATDRTGQIAALTRSNAELATLGRSIAHLTALLSHGSVRAAQEYRQTLDTLDGDVRAHLGLAAALLSDPWLHRPPAASSRSPHE